MSKMYDTFGIVDLGWGKVDVPIGRALNEGGKDSPLLFCLIIGMAFKHLETKWKLSPEAPAPRATNTDFVPTASRLNSQHQIVNGNEIVNEQINQNQQNQQDLDNETQHDEEFMSANGDEQFVTANQSEIEEIQDLLVRPTTFADDITLSATSKLDAIECMTDLVAITAAFGLSVNWDKTVFIAASFGGGPEISDTDKEPLEVTLDGVVHRVQHSEQLLLLGYGLRAGKQDFIGSHMDVRSIERKQDEYRKKIKKLR
mmetsp:Transcript_50984/g.111114  ORF Transcript_50984/g.111114 Transcript_50984/m.111114 type:complete len:257 (+) Transcript_50984:390-1160(+)|eukprot:CAMPEP_0116900690 /NCGR_PEP_ID=MMETSP0467-20121206/8863_1 /TAXON_ID=283647 /ORGANISM="Mesodinium pulex, Strain SPMC105" /LENGTH=256 /DNA_ID=CAMNT_0004573971 /DNA_START=362 /DNA_END=1132 /DNA_ORIENTATION=+